MGDFLLRSAGELAARVGDWLSFRFLVQPSVAAILAIRAGVRDAAAHRPPFLATFLRRPSARGMLMRDAWHDIARLFAAAAAIDVLYQYVVLRSVHPLQALIVAVSLAVVPYVVIRGPCSRLVRRGGVCEVFHRRRDAAWRRRVGRGTAAEVRREGDL